MPLHLSVGQQRFNHYDKKYQACCNNGHALNVAKTICVIELVLALLSVVLLGAGPTSATHYYATNGLMGGCCCVTLIGLYKHNKGCVLTGVIYHAVISALVAGAGIYVIAIGVDHASEIDIPHYSGLLVKRYLLVIGGTTALCAAFYAWLCLVHVSAYRYLRDAGRAGVRPLGHADCELVYASGGVLAYNEQLGAAAEPPTQVRATSFEQAEQPPKY